MVEAKQGSGHTTSKRRQGRSIRNPEVRRMVRNGEYSPSSELTPERGWKSEDEHLYKCRDVAKQESLVYYFNEDWFDFESLTKENRSEGTSKIRYSSSPNRCEYCKKAWCRISDGGSDNFYYLDNTNFANVRMDKESCPNCA